MEVGEVKEDGGSRWEERVCISPSLRPLEEVELNSINHNGN